jgi:hypothetical protein
MFEHPGSSMAFFSELLDPRTSNRADSGYAGDKKGIEKD